MYPTNRMPKADAAAAPLAGTLWLFPGAIAHLVMRTLVPTGTPTSDRKSRISVAVNYTHAPNPAPGPVAQSDTA